MCSKRFCFSFFQSRAENRAGNSTVFEHTLVVQQLIEWLQSKWSRHHGQCDMRRCLSWYASVFIATVM